MKVKNFVPLIAEIIGLKIFKLSFMVVLIIFFFSKMLLMIITREVNTGVWYKVIDG